MRDVNNLRRDSKRTLNIIDIFNALLSKLRARLTRQVGANELQVEVQVNRWKLLMFFHNEVTSSRSKGDSEGWARAKNHLKTGPSSATPSRTYGERKTRYKVYGYLHFITEIFSNTWTGLVLTNQCRTFVKHGNPGKLPKEVLYDLITAQWLARIISTIGRVKYLNHREGYQTNWDRDMGGGKIAEKANAQGNSWDTQIKRDIQGNSVPDRLSMPNSVLSWGNTSSKRKDMRKYSTTTQDSPKKEVGRTNKKIQWPDSREWKVIMEDVYQKQIELVNIAETCGFHSKETERKQIILSRSLNFVLLAVRKTIQNTGSRTPGVDNKILTISSSESEKLEMVNKIQKLIVNANYQSDPVKGVKIPKANGKTRTLGIPTFRDRCLQGLMNLVLEPLVECRSDHHSYGYRKHRSAKHALGYLRNLFYSRFNLEDKYVLDADIKGFFDNISHEWLLNNLPLPNIHKKIIDKWLKAKMFSGKVILDREMGTPQGGIISPTLANFTLNGLEKVIDNSTSSITKSRLKTKALRSGIKLNLAVATVRYADDFIVTARSKYLIETYIAPEIEKFLKERGLELSKEKTKIITVKEGLYFLGYTLKYRKHWKVRDHFFKERIGNEGIALYPQKNKVYGIITKLRNEFRKSYNESAYTLISKINPILRGWYGYYNLSQSTKFRGYVRQAVFRFCGKWAMKKHPKWGWRRIVNTYFLGIKHESGLRKKLRSNWVFRGVTKVDSRFTEKAGKGKTNYLVSPTDIPIVNAASVSIPVNLREVHAYHPENYKLQEWNEKISERTNGRNLKSKIWKAKAQEGKCKHCGGEMRNEKWEIQLDTHITELRPELHHIIPISLGGSKSSVKNMELIHNECHKMKHKAAG